jgi:hypothetical protein
MALYPRYIVSSYQGEEACLVQVTRMLPKSFWKSPVKRGQTKVTRLLQPNVRLIAMFPKKKESTAQAVNL